MRPRVLLVEDDEIIREIYTLKFALEGYPVASAENGEVGLRMINEFEPEIVLLDMMMPVMGGLDFMKRLKASGKKMPEIIVFSNISAPKQVDAVMRLGAKAYWTKSDYTPDRCVVALAEFWQSGAGGTAAV